MKKTISTLFMCAAICGASATEIARPEMIVNPADQKCGENCSPLCGYITRIRAAKLEDFNVLPVDKCAVKASVDEENFYVDVYLEDKDIICEATSPANSKLYNVADAVQIMVATEKHPRLWEVNVTASGVANTFLYPGPGALLPGCARKFEAKHEIKLNGTLNNSKDVDKSWSVRVAIPLKELRQGGLKFRDNENWLIQVHCYNYSSYLNIRDISSYPQTISTHTYDGSRFARLDLSKTRK